MEGKTAKGKIDRNIYNKKILLYGNEKIQEDFRYLYQDLDIETGFSWNDTEYIKDNLKNCFIVVCEKNANADFERIVEEWNLHYGKEYCYITDLFFYYNPMFLERKGRKLAVWGTGVAADELWEKLERIGIASEIDFFVDNSRDKASFLGRKVQTPEQIKDRKDVYIVVATYLYHWEIYSQLEEYGFREQKDYIHCTEAAGDYRELLEKVCFTEKKYSCHCSRPLGYCDAIGDQLYLCCPDFLPVSAGSMKSASFMGCWNSYMARILRLSVLNGTFAFCDQIYCDLFDFEEEDTTQINPELNYEGNYAKYPNTLMVGIDYSCNLKCPSCRNDVCVAGVEERNEMERQAEDLLEHVIPYVNRLWLAGSGEVFFSKIYRKILDDERCKRRGNISIFTNGTLLNETNWTQLERFYKSIDIVVSMDGIRDETIKMLRRGADSKVLKRNLNFLGELRKKGKIKNLFLSCVLQAANIAELYELLEYCKEIGVDKVQFLKLKDNGVYVDGNKFDLASVFDDNDCLKKEYTRYFTEKVLMHPLADWFNSSKKLNVERRPRLDQYDTL